MKKTITYPLAIGTLLILAIAIPGLFAVNYLAGIALLSGLFLWWLASVLFVPIQAIFQRHGRSIWKFSLLLGSLGGLLIITFLIRYPRYYLLSPPTFIKVKSYKATIEPIDIRSGKFKINEKVTYLVEGEGVSQAKELVAEHAVSLPEKQINSVGRGFLLKEVRIAPLRANDGSVEEVVLSDRTRDYVHIYTDSSSVASVELREFPRDSFYESRETSAPTRIPYLYSETVTWTCGSIDRGFAFTYLPPPFHYKFLRVILTPFAGAASTTNWVIGILVILGIILGIPLKTVLTDIIKDQFKSWFGKQPEKKSVGFTPFE